MGDRLRKSWCVWACLILEFIGAAIIGKNPVVYSFFVMGVVAVFELYILLKLPYSDKLWLYEESVNNPKCIKIRWIGLVPILAISYFLRTALLYAFFYSILIEAPTLYFAGTEETKNKIRADVLENAKGIAIMILIIGGVVLYAISLSKSMFG